MRRKSDRRSRVISATEASRTFSSILDRVESGQRFVIQRHGRPVCLVAPPPAESRRASECLALLQGRDAVLLDDRFGEDMQAIIAGEPIEGRPWGS